MRTCLLITALLISIVSVSQNETNNWYFGNNAGISFASGTPIAITNGALSTREGCASISDDAGMLLFYTDGQTVWNRNHVVMNNGTGLLGSSSSTQSAIIIQKPQSTTIYYIFTVPQCNDNDGLRYSVVDISLAAGLGSVVSKNYLLVQPVVEKVTAVRHANNLDVWVVTHGRQDNVFYSFLVSPSGVNDVPVISNTGTVHSLPTSNYVGYLKASPDGNYIALALQYPLSMFELFSFNKSTGKPSNPIAFNNYLYAYGLEFSPDASRLYLGKLESNREIYQINLQAGSSAAIINSAVLIASSTLQIGALQLGSDGKIYCVLDYGYYLGVINDPNALGTACNYQGNAVYLGGKQGRIGLPTFLQSYFIPFEFTFTNTCFGSQTSFSIVNPVGITSVLWDFGDGGTSALMAPFHVYSLSGTYTVTLTTYSGGTSASSNQVVVINPAPVVNLGSDRWLCAGTPCVLNAGSGMQSYLWNNGSSNQTLSVTASGNYSVTVTDYNGCSANDGVLVVFKPIPSPKLIKHN